MEVGPALFSSEETENKKSIMRNGEEIIKGCAIPDVPGHGMIVARRRSRRCLKVPRWSIVMDCSFLSAVTADN